MISGRLHPEQVVAGGNPSHVTPVAGVVHHEIQSGPVALAGEVDRDRHRPGRAVRRLERERLGSDRVVTHRSLVRQRPVTAGIDERDPPFAGTRDHDTVGVIEIAIAVHVSGRDRAEGRLAEHPPEVGAAGPSDHHPQPFELEVLHPHGAAPGIDRPKGHSPLVGELPQVQQLPLTGRRALEAGQARIDAGVEDRNEDPTTVERRIGDPEDVCADAPQRHETGEPRQAGRQRRLQRQHDRVILARRELGTL
jgi:hypothetical protein